MNASILALGLYRSSGGPSKSVAAFQRALSASVISWVDPVAHTREALIWDLVDCPHHVVSCSSLPVLRQFCYPQRRGLAEAERIVAASHLVSCHSFWRWHNLWLERVAARHRVPYWFVPHGALDPYVMESDKLAKRAFLSLGGRRFLDGARAVVCATQREYEKLAPLMPQARPFILPWPLDDSDFRGRDDTSRERVRKSLGIPEDAVVFLYFGRLHPMKRPLETITAFATGAPPTARLLMVGNECGVTVADCRAEAVKHRVPKRVHVIGPAYGGERAGYIDAADIYVSLSHRENFNFTAAEAIAIGLPVMLSPGNDIGPELRAVDCGWLMDSDDTGAATMAAVGGLSPVEIAAKGQRGRAWARAHLRYEAFAGRLQEFAAQIAAEH
jgi:glycosyltransferase involved in cell wall biosynthesis